MHRACTANKSQLVAAKERLRTEEPMVIACPDRTPAVLIVEDDAVLGAALGLCVEEAGYAVAGFAQSVDAALAELGRQPIDAALLDINLQGELVYPVAQALAQRGVPFVFVTAGPRSAIPEAYRNRPVVPKPYYDAALCAALASMLPPAP
jgi:CheY-like chemotaxis protein